MAILGQEDGRRVPYLDGLRGWAAVMVLVGHLVMMVWPTILVAERYPAATPAWQLNLAASPLSAFWDGRLAVSIFFVLSGYVLTGAATARQSSFVALVGKRYLRLVLPVLAATLPTLLLKPQGWYFNHELAYVTGSNWLDSVTSSGFQPTMLGWLRNAFWVVFFIDGHTSYNALLWTMKFEWYGSLLVFLIARLLPGRLWRLSVALLLLAVLGQVPGYAVLHLFMAGMILHDATVMMRAWQGDRPPSSSLVGDVAGIFLVGLGFYLPRLIMMMIDAQGTSLMALLWLRQALPSWQGDRWMLAAIPVVVGVLLSPKLRYFLSNSLGRFLGKISFPLYLFHLPVILSLGSWLLLSLLSRTNLIPAALVAFAVTASVALLIAWIMTILVEAPTLRLAGRFGALIDRAWAWICPWYRVLPIKGAA